MAKQYIVRLRKGSATGNVVASSQIITVDGLGDNVIAPTDFIDNRSSGSVTTENYTGAFTRTLVSPQWTLVCNEHETIGGFPITYLWSTNITGVTSTARWYPVYPDTLVPYAGVGLNITIGENNTIETAGYTGTFTVPTTNVTTPQQVQMTLWTDGFQTSKLLARSHTCLITPAKLEVQCPGAVTVGDPVRIILTGVPNETVTYTGQYNGSGLTGTVVLNNQGTLIFDIFGGVKRQTGFYCYSFVGNKTTNSQECCFNITDAAIPDPTPTPTPSSAAILTLITVDGPAKINKCDLVNLTLSGGANENLRFTYKPANIVDIYFDYYPDVAEAYKVNSYGLTKQAFAQTYYDSNGAKTGKMSPSDLNAYHVAQLSSLNLTFKLNSNGELTATTNSKCEILPRITQYCWQVTGDKSSNSVDYCLNVEDDWGVPIPTPTPSPAVATNCPVIDVSYSSADGWQSTLQEESEDTLKVSYTIKNLNVAGTGNTPQYRTLAWEVIATEGTVNDYDFQPSTPPKGTIRDTNNDSLLKATGLQGSFNLTVRKEELITISNTSASASIATALRYPLKDNNILRIWAATSFQDSQVSQFPIEDATSRSAFLWLTPTSDTFTQVWDASFKATTSRLNRDVFGWRWYYDFLQPELSCLQFNYGGGDSTDVRITISKNTWDNSDLYVDFVIRFGSKTLTMGKDDSVLFAMGYYAIAVSGFSATGPKYLGFVTFDPTKKVNGRYDKWGNYGIPFKTEWTEGFNHFRFFMSFKDYKQNKIWVNGQQQPISATRNSYLVSNMVPRRDILGQVIGSTYETKSVVYSEALNPTRIANKGQFDDESGRATRFQLGSFKEKKNDETNNISNKGFDLKQLDIYKGSTFPDMPTGVASLFTALSPTTINTADQLEKFKIRFYLETNKSNICYETQEVTIGFIPDPTPSPTPTPTPTSSRASTPTPTPTRTPAPTPNATRTPTPEPTTTPTPTPAATATKTPTPTPTPTRTITPTPTPTRTITPTPTPTPTITKTPTPTPTITKTPTPTPAPRYCVNITSISEDSNRNIVFTLSPSGVATSISVRVSKNGSLTNEGNYSTIWSWKTGEPGFDGTSGRVSMDRYNAKTGDVYWVSIRASGTNCVQTTGSSGNVQNFRWAAPARRDVRVPGFFGQTGVYFLGPFTTECFWTSYTLLPDGDMEERNGFAERYGFNPQDIWGGSASNIPNWPSKLVGSSTVNVTSYDMAWHKPLKDNIGQHYEVMIVPFSSGNKQSKKVTNNGKGNTLPGVTTNMAVGGWVGLESSRYIIVYNGPSQTQAGTRAEFVLYFRRKGTNPTFPPLNDFVKTSVGANNEYDPKDDVSAAISERAFKIKGYLGGP